MLALGQKVEWTSQAAGVAVYKQGVVVEVVPAGKKPSKRFKSLYRANGVQTVNPRRTTSYVIELTKGEGARKHYWPRVDALQLVTPEEEELVTPEEEEFDNNENDEDEGCW